MRALGAAALAATMAIPSCKQPQAPAPGSLQKSFERLARSPACAVTLPMEWVSSWPIPTGKEQGRQFVALFYSLDRRAEGPDGMPLVRVTAPRGMAIFSSGGAVSSCQVAPAQAQPLNGQRYPPAAMRLEEEEFDKDVEAFLKLTETVAGYYAQGQDKPDTTIVADYWKAFERLGEPALRSYYYEANPEFWEWLRRVNGKSLPPSGQAG